MPWEGATEYRVYRDGKRVRTTAMPEYALTQTQFASPGQYQSSAVRGGVESFRSEPFEVGPAPVQAKVEGGKSVAAGTESTVNLQTIGVTGAVFPAGRRQRRNLSPDGAVQQRQRPSEH